jgi:hypothetical protein
MRKTRRRFLTVLALVAVSVLVTVGVGTVAASAAPSSEVCTNEGAKSLCANRKGGGTAPGTYVIAWSAGDNNNGFEYVFLTAMCRNGYVTQSCPFSTNGNLNYRYLGKAIVAIHALGTDLCIADSGTNFGSTVLGACPDPSGGGPAANGTIFVLAQVSNRSVPPPTTDIVNRYWSNNQSGGKGTSPAWLCRIAKSVYLWEDSPSGTAAACQWNLIH